MENIPIGIYKCSVSDCSISTTGKCVNGLPIADCTNKIPIFKDSESLEQDPIPEVAAKPLTRKLPWGDVFDDNNLPNVTNRFPAKMVLVIGEPKVGKSTLYAAIIDRFHKGEFEKYFFHSTRTPIGFERICHLARIKSKGEKPDTERTKSYQFSYLHLSIRDKTLNGYPKHLIFADVNGERFQDARNSDDEVRKLTILKRCDYIFFVADGLKLTSNETKHIAKQDVWKIIDRCRQNNMWPENLKIHLLVTKWDEVVLAGKVDEITTFFISPTQKKYNNILGQIIQIASRSMSKEVPSRTGIEQFIDICMEKASMRKIEEDCPITIQRQFQKFKFRAVDDDKLSE